MKWSLVPPDCIAGPISPPPNLATECKPLCRMASETKPRATPPPTRWTAAVDGRRHGHVFQTVAILLRAIVQLYVFAFVPRFRCNRGQACSSSLQTNVIHASHRRQMRRRTRCARDDPARSGLYQFQVFSGDTNWFRTAAIGTQSVAVVVKIAPSPCGYCDCSPWSTRSASAVGRYLRQLNRSK